MLIKHNKFVKPFSTISLFLLVTVTTSNNSLQLILLKYTLYLGLESKFSDNLDPLSTSVSFTVRPF